MSEDRPVCAIRRGYVACSLGQLHFREARPEQPGDKPALVLLHQNPSSSGEYENLIRAMAEDRHVIAFDTPGNGMSDRPDAPLSMEGYAEILAQGMAGLGLGRDRPVDLFGYHSGTYLATELAIALPDHCGRLVLSGIPYRPAQERAANLAAAQSVTMPADDGDEIFEWLRWMWRFIVTERLPGVSMEAAVRTFADKTAAMHRRAWVYHGVWSYDAAERLPMVRQPVLILQPDEPLTAFAPAAAALFPDARLIHLPTLSRDVFEVGADVFAAAMRDFLV